MFNRIASYFSSASDEQILGQIKIYLTSSSSTPILEEEIQQVDPLQLKNFSPLTKPEQALLAAKILHTKSQLAGNRNKGTETEFGRSRGIDKRLSEGMA